MIKRNHLIKNMVLLAVDAGLLYTSLVITLILRYSSGTNLDGMLTYHLWPFTAIFGIWILMFMASGLYDLRYNKNGKLFLYRLLRVMAINLIIAIAVFYTFPLRIEPRRNLLAIAGLSTIFIFAWRFLFNSLIVKTSTNRILFLGANRESIELAEYLLKNPQLGQKPAAFIITEALALKDPLPLPHYPLEQNLLEITKEVKADTIVITPEFKEDKKIVNSLFQVLPSGVVMADFTRFYETLTGKIPLYLIGEVWFLENLTGVRKSAYNFAKRTIDIILAVIMGVFAVLLFPLIALAIELESPGPVFFRQKRVGRNGQNFELLKYRSSRRTSVGKHEGWSKESGNIYTRVGRFLRSTYLDELPQIINILRGEMSFIGPRPERPEFVEDLEKTIPFYKMRLLAQPGITGWAQINMENDAAAKDAPEKIQYDLYYLKNRNLTLDLLIALRTIYALLKREGR